ncbi:MAG: trigger factor [Thermodesulfobacteriota bacterium]|nr:trigger factor [Thermodesulfobacteriota bacterium]
MKTRVEDISSVKKKLLIQIDSEEVNKKFEAAYKELRKTAKVPGFRPKKAPRNILERHFGSQVTEDVMKDIITDTFPQALNEVGIAPLGLPVFEKETLKQGQDFSYSVVTEVRPQFELKNYLGLEVEKERCSVEEGDVLNQLEQIRETHGELISIDEERPIQKDDYVVLDYEGFENSQPLDGIKSSNFLVKVGSNNFHSKFEESLIGLKKNADAEINVDFEDSYYHTKLAGKNINFQVKVMDIKEMHLPDLNDEFAQTLGDEIKTLEELKNKVRETFTAREEKRIDSELKQRLLEKVSDGIDFELPQVLVESELDQAVEKVKQNLVRGGSTLDNAGLSEEKLRNDLRPGSENRVKHMLILSEITKVHEITINDKDLEQEFAELSSAMGQPIETVRKYYNSKNVMDFMEERLLEEKTLNYLVEHANIIEVEKGVLVKDNSAEKEDK